MKSWKRNALAAAVLVLVCGGIWLNWRYETQNTAELVSTLDAEKILDSDRLVLQTEGNELEVLANEGLNKTDTAEQVFARMRLSRQQSRDSAVHLLQETIAYAGEDEDLSAGALQLEAIVKTALSEASIESLVISKGFSECVAYMTEEGIDLAVASQGLTEAEAAMLTDVILSQTDYDLSQIRIIEVNEN